MSVDQPATEADLVHLLGELDPFTISQILSIAPSRDELDEAVQETQDEAGFGEEPRTPSSARVANVRAVLEDLARSELDLDQERQP